MPMSGNRRQANLYGLRHAFRNASPALVGGARQVTWRVLTRLRTILAVVCNIGMKR